MSAVIIFCLLSGHHNLFARLDQTLFPRVDGRGRKCGGQNVSFRGGYSSGCIEVNWDVVGRLYDKVSALCNCAAP